MEEFTGAPVESQRSVEVIAARAGVVPQPTVCVDIRDPNDLVANDGNGRVVIEIKNALEQAIRGIRRGGDEPGEEVLILRGTGTPRWQPVHPVLSVRSQHPSAHATTHFRRPFPT